MKVLSGMGAAILIVLFLTSGVSYAQSSAKESYYKGVEYAVQGKFEESKKEFEKALETDPSHRPAEQSLIVISFCP